MYQHSGYERTPPPRRQRRRKNFRIRMLPPLMGPQNLPLPMKNLLTPPHGLGPLAHVCCECHEYCIGFPVLASGIQISTV